MSDLNNPGSEVTLRRAARFFGDGGLCDRYERRGDGLIEFNDIVTWLAGQPGLTRETIMKQFVLAAKYGEFGRRRGKIDQLVDLHGFNEPTCGQYSLRPSWLKVEARPQTMRARRSTWMRWLQEQNWPVPAWLSRPAIVTDATRNSKIPIGKSKRGAPPKQAARLKAAMRAMDPARLGSMGYDEMATTFGAAASTCAKYRKEVLAANGGK